MQYSELEELITSYNDLVNRINSVMDKEIAEGDVENPPYDTFEIMKATDENAEHLPYLYLRFVYLPYLEKSVSNEKK